MNLLLAFLGGVFLTLSAINLIWSAGVQLGGAVKDPTWCVPIAVICGGLGFLILRASF
jgi:hypothetical protein